MGHKHPPSWSPTTSAISSFKLCVFTGCMATLTNSTKENVSHFSVWFFLNECNEERWWREREKWTIQEWLKLIFSEGNKNVV